jgi:hypothetical protein
VIVERQADILQHVGRHVVSLECPGAFERADGDQFQLSCAGTLAGTAVSESCGCQQTRMVERGGPFGEQPHLVQTRYIRAVVPHL